MSHITMQRRMGIAGAMLCGLTFAAAAWANDPAEKFKSMDTNGDGMVSADEHATAVKGMFDQMDSNHDGNVTAAEMDAAHQKMKGSMGGMEHKGGQHGAQDRAEHEGHMPMGHGMSSADKIAKMDTNGDGMLSASEHDAGARKMFDEMDADKNGSLSQEEMRAGHAMMMKEKGR
jgi:Ca2+-binding EF-hand superfamily protein